ncbi:MAG: dihydroorotate dehydrogenase electron transfer subunit, partial [Bacteroidota bacterium]
MKTILDLKITGKRRLTPWHFTMTAMSPEKLPDIKPGQFAEILVDNSKATFLRRPFSIHDVCLEEQT